MGRHHGAGTLAKADRHEAVTNAAAGEDHLVSVLEVTPELAVGERDWVLLIRGQLEQAGQLRISGPEMVPLPSKSPDCRSHPPEVW